jgi:hypothetical protein
MTFSAVGRSRGLLTLIPMSSNEIARSFGKISAGETPPCGSGSGDNLTRDRLGSIFSNRPASAPILAGLLLRNCGLRLASMTMGLLDFLGGKEQKQRVALAYKICNWIVPPALFENPEQVIAHLENAGTSGLHKLVVDYYLEKGSLPRVEILPQIVLYACDLRQGTRCLLISYPRPPKQAVYIDGMRVVEPFFSAIVYSCREPSKPSYLVLERSLDCVATVVRGHTRDSKLNLGPGCPPDRERFISYLRGDPKDT